LVGIIIRISKCLPVDNFGIISNGSFPFFIFLSAIKTCKKVQLWETIKNSDCKVKTSYLPQTGAGTDGLLTSPGFIYSF
jgi:hypothetical protein